MCYRGLRCCGDVYKRQVKGDADVTVVVAAADAKISLKDYKGKAAVIVSEDNVAISDAPAGTEIEAAENVTGVTANGTGVSEGTEITIPDKSTSGGGSSGGSGGGSEPAVNAAQEATDKAWSTLKTELEKITGNNGDPLVTASSDEKGAYQLTLNVDAIQAGSGASVSYTHLDVYKRQCTIVLVLFFMSGLLFYLYYCNTVFLLCLVKYAH